MLGPCRFRFLNEIHEVRTPQDWNHPGRDKLWLYNLHYFDDLTAENTDERKQWHRNLVDRWIKENPPGSGNGWESYPISLRIVNWIKWFLSAGKPFACPSTDTHDSASVVSAPLSITDFLHSLAVQARYLRQRLESHLLGNHLFANAKALVFAGLFFSGKEADSWLNKGLGILSREVSEQILTDGGHFERSPMYHGIIFEDCLDLLNILNTYSFAEPDDISTGLTQLTRKMAKFLRGMTHPDGRIALFNDAALGIAMPPEDLIDYHERLTGKKLSSPETTLWSFPDTGYYVMAPRTEDRLLVDCGPVGPDYQPGHSHCDTLSFELSLKGRRIIVDSGCFQYVDGPVRQYNRGNAGHNTITIDGRNQSEVWHAHRCARRARPLYADIEKRPDGSLVFEGAHDGYCRLPGRPVHHRRIHWSADTCRIDDTVTGSGRHDIETRIHIHPSLDVDIRDDGAMIRDDQNIMAVISPHKASRIEKRQGWYCPEFGIKKSCIVIAGTFDNVALPFQCGWQIKINA